MELNEIAKSEGQDAMLKRAREMERNRRRRERQARRKQFEAQARNRNIQLAAQRLLADQPAPQPQPTGMCATQPPANSPAGVPNTPSPAGAATMTAQNKAGAGAPSGEPGLRSIGVVAVGGILGKADDRAQSRSDGTARKLPQPEGTPAVAKASEGAA